MTRLAGHAGLPGERRDGGGRAGKSGQENDDTCCDSDTTVLGCGLILGLPRQRSCAGHMGSRFLVGAVTAGPDVSGSRDSFRVAASQEHSSAAMRPPRELPILRAWSTVPYCTLPSVSCVESFQSWSRCAGIRTWLALGAGCRNSTAIGYVVVREPYSRGSTGSLSRARTPKTHSWTRLSGSRRTNRSSPSMPSANSRSASERLPDRPRSRSRSRCSGSVYSGPVDDPQVLAAAALHRRLQKAASARRHERQRLDDRALAAGLRQRLPPARSPRPRSPDRLRSTT